MAVRVRRPRADPSRLYEDAPLFASEANPACGPSIRQGAGPMFTLWSKRLGNQWSIGNWDGMRHAMPRELPASMLRALAAVAPADADQPSDGPPQDLKEYDPEWGHTLASGRATASCDHENMLSHVKVPVLFTHHFRQIDPATGALLGAISDHQVRHVEHLITTAAGARSPTAPFPQIPPLDARPRPADLHPHRRRLGCTTRPMTPDVRLCAPVKRLPLAVSATRVDIQRR